MSAGLGFKGLDAFAKELTLLPEKVRAELKPVIVRKAQELQATVQGEYAARGVASVGDGMRVEVDSDPSSLGARVVNPSPIGHLYEQGTSTRYDDQGRHRGRMPAANVLVPAAERARAELVPELEAALARVGQ